MTDPHVATQPGRYAQSSGWFAIAVGVLMIVLWIGLLVTGDVPQLEPRPLGVALHIAGEIVTAIVLIVAGRGLIAGARWARRLYLLAIGMLMIAIIHAVAWYGEEGNVGMVIAVLVLAVLAVFFALRAEE